MKTIQPFNLEDIKHIGGVDHPESIGIGPDGTAYTTGTGCQVYRLNLDDNTAEQFATTEVRCLGSVVDADENLYVAHTTVDVLKITPAGEVTVYATGPGGDKFMCANYPAFDSLGNMYLSESGDWSGAINGRLYKIPPGGEKYNCGTRSRSIRPTPSPWMQKKNISTLWRHLAAASRALRSTTMARPVSLSVWSTCQNTFPMGSLSMRRACCGLPVIGPIRFTRST